MTIQFFLVTTSLHGLFRDGFTVLKKEGLLAAMRGLLRVLNLNYQGYWWYAKYLYRVHLCRSCETTNPFTVMRVAPNEITHRPDPPLDRWGDLGAVTGGDWDDPGRPIETSMKYRSVVDRFDNGTDWPETEIYQEAVNRIEAGKSFWNGSLSLNDIKQRTEDLDNLYETIRDKGYRSQAELHGKSLRELTLSRTFDRSMEEVAVAIGRDGDVLLVDGYHRLAIAQVLDLEWIPVHVVARHPECDEIPLYQRSDRFEEPWFE